MTFWKSFHFLETSCLPWNTEKEFNKNNEYLDETSLYINCTLFTAKPNNFTRVLSVFLTKQVAHLIQILENGSPLLFSFRKIKIYLPEKYTILLIFFLLSFWTTQITLCKQVVDLVQTLENGNLLLFPFLRYKLIFWMPIMLKYWFKNDSISYICI